MRQRLRPVCTRASTSAPQPGLPKALHEGVLPPSLGPKQPILNDDVHDLTSFAQSLRILPLGCMQSGLRPQVGTVGGFAKTAQVMATVSAASCCTSPRTSAHRKSPKTASFSDSFIQLLTGEAAPGDCFGEESGARSRGAIASGVRRKVAGTPPCLTGAFVSGHPGERGSYSFATVARVG